MPVPESALSPSLFFCRLMFSPIDGTQASLPSPLPRGMCHAVAERAQHLRRVQVSMCVSLPPVVITSTRSMPCYGDSKSATRVRSLSLTTSPRSHAHTYQFLRYELPVDDPELEQQRRERMRATRGIDEESFFYPNHVDTSSCAWSCLKRVRVCWRLLIL